MGRRESGARFQQRVASWSRVCAALAPAVALVVVQTLSFSKTRKRAVQRQFPERVPGNLPRPRPSSSRAHWASGNWVSGNWVSGNAIECTAATVQTCIQFRWSVSGNMGFRNYSHTSLHSDDQFNTALTVARGDSNWPVTGRYDHQLDCAGFPSLHTYIHGDTPRSVHTVTSCETTVSVAPLVRPDRRGPEPSHREPMVGRAMV